MALSPRQQAFQLSQRQERPLDLYQHLPFRIAVISNLLMLDRDISIRNASELGPRELRVLLNVGSYMPITSADVAYQTRVDTYTVSRAVTSLHRQGYLAFEESPTNRRVKLLTLTEKGQEIYKQIVPQIEKRADALGDVLTDAESAEFIRMLTLVENRAEQLLADQAREHQQLDKTLPADQKELIRWHKKSSRETFES